MANLQDNHTSVHLRLGQIWKKIVKLKGALRYVAWKETKLREFLLFSFGENDENLKMKF